MRHVPQLQLWPQTGVAPGSRPHTHFVHTYYYIFRVNIGQSTVCHVERSEPLVAGPKGKSKHLANVSCKVPAQNPSSRPSSSSRNTLNKVRLVALDFHRIFRQAEGNGQSESHTHRHASLLTRLPFGHGVNHAQRLLVEMRIHRLYHLSIADGAIWINYKLHDDAPLQPLFLADFRVANMLFQILHQCFHATRELGLEFYHLEDSTSSRNHLSYFGYLRTHKLVFYSANCSRLVLGIPSHHTGQKAKE